MPSKFVLLAMAFFFSAAARADYVCRWSAEGTNEFYQRRNQGGVYDQAPVVRQANGCVPVCMGLAYCRTPGNRLPPFVSLVGCQGKSDGSCPDATTCMDDQTVQLSEDFTTVSEVAPPSNPRPGPTGAGDVQAR